MDKVFNFFSKGKSKEEIEKLKRNTVIKTQNLETLANVNLSSINNNNEKDSEIINNTKERKTINFSSQDFKNIDKILSEKQENESKSEIVSTEIVNNSPGVIKTDNPMDQANLMNQAQNFIYNKNNNGLINKPLVGDVVIVNSIENIKKPSEGYYTKKHREQISNLKSVSFN
jgi:hypothetical protein